MITIYMIEDINDLKYVGSTKQKLSKRLSQHKTSKLRDAGCSSAKLNLHNCSIISLETCNEVDRKEREKYYINNTDCVNVIKYKFNWAENGRQYYQNNKQQKAKYYQNNKAKIKEYGRKYRARKKEKQRLENVELLFSE